MTLNTISKNAPGTGRPERSEFDGLAVLKELYPELTADQLLETKERLDGYFNVVLKIFLEHNKDNELIDRPLADSYYESKVDSPS
jgi:hypothetical protein